MRAQISNITHMPLFNHPSSPYISHSST